MDFRILASGLHRPLLIPQPKQIFECFLLSIYEYMDVYGSTAIVTKAAPKICTQASRYTANCRLRYKAWLAYRRRIAILAATAHGVRSIDKRVIKSLRHLIQFEGWRHLIWTKLHCVGRPGDMNVHRLCMQAWTETMSLFRVTSDKINIRSNGHKALTAHCKSVSFVPFRSRKLSRGRKTCCRCQQRLESSSGSSGSVQLRITSRKILKQLSSLNLAIVELALIAALSGVGTVIKQNESTEYYLQNYPGELIMNTMSIGAARIVVVPYVPFAIIILSLLFLLCWLPLLLYCWLCDR